MIKLFQNLDYLLYINLELPANAKAVLKFFDLNLFRIIPNIFWVSEPEGENCLDLHPILLEQEDECFVMNNIGNLIYQMVFILGLKLFFTIIEVSVLKIFTKE